MVNIHIIDKATTTDIDTSAYVLIYFQDGKFKVEGNGEIDLKDLAPIIMKAVADKMK